MNIPVDVLRMPVLVGLNVLVKIGILSCFRSKLNLSALCPPEPSYVVRNNFCDTVPYDKSGGSFAKSLRV